MNILILSLLLAGVSSNIIFHGVVRDNFDINRSKDMSACPPQCPSDFWCKDGKCPVILTRRPFSSLPCTAECAPGQICKEGACVGIDMFQSDRYEFQNKNPFFSEKCGDDWDCGLRKRCYDGKCRWFCFEESDCPASYSCHGGVCVKMRRSFSAGCAVPCGPGKTCMNGSCVQDV